MEEPEAIHDVIANHFSSGNLKGKKVLVTAGPTYEAIDPVRFIGNHSTGKMGYAIALAAANEGAHVTLVSGPTDLQISNSNIKVVNVTSADEMYSECKKLYPKIDICVLSAAVADYKPKTKADQKIKKKSDSFSLELIKTHDIAAELGKLKKKGQINVGFALETENESSNAEGKLKSKNFDFIVLNSLNDKGAGFGHDTNKITIIDKNNKSKAFTLKSKQEVARDIVNFIIDVS